MSSYAANFTPRYRVKYLAGGIIHTMQVRHARGSTFSDTEALREQVRLCFNDMAGVLYSDFAWISADVALTDDDVFAPAAVPASTPTGSIDETLFSPVERIKGLTFSGRAAGSRAKFTMFGLVFSDVDAGDGAGDGKLTSAEVAAVGTIATRAAIYFRANSGSSALFPNVATYKENDHLLKLVRRGIIS